MIDSLTARLTDARTILTRAAVEVADGEVRASIHLALAACGNALEAHKNGQEEDSE